MRRPRRLEGRLHRGRGAQMALPLLQQEVNPPLTGAVFEHCRKPHTAWVSFIRLMCHNVSVECADELCGVTHKTAFEWRHRVLATVSGQRDRVVLAGYRLG